MNLNADYERWISLNESETETACRPLKEADHPAFSVVMRLGEAGEERLNTAIASVTGQTLSPYELIVVDDRPSGTRGVSDPSAFEDDPKVRVIRLSEGGIADALNAGMRESRGEFILFLDGNDILAPNALWECAKLLEVKPGLDYIYSDEDRLTEDRARRHTPFFKPDWSPDTLRSFFYTGQLSVFRRTKALETGAFENDCGKAAVYDFTLRFTENLSGERIGHIPKILCHVRDSAAGLGPDDRDDKAGDDRRVKEAMLKRRGIKGRTVLIGDLSQHRIVYDPPSDAFVSIIIPSKDNPAMLKTCVDAIERHAGRIRYEVIVVDNGSSDENRQKISAYLEGRPAAYLYGKEEFNFSRMCRRGAAAAKGGFLLFLNDDVEAVTDHFLEILSGAASQPHTGAVGAKLLYPDSTVIQHIGVTNLRTGPAHALMGADDRNVYYFGRNRAEYDWIAVTGAALMVERSKYEASGGFDEGLRVAYNDVDLCFKLFETGYFNVVRNDVVMYHHESASRGLDDQSAEKAERLTAERNRLYAGHPGIGTTDPFHNVNLTPVKVDYDLDLPASDGGPAAGGETDPAASSASDIKRRCRLLLGRIRSFVRKIGE